MASHSLHAALLRQLHDRRKPGRACSDGMGAKKNECCSPLAPPLAPHLCTSVLTGLLSSSCCLLQLVLNTFAVGCAGFNKVLGPIRSQVCGVPLVQRCTPRSRNHVITPPQLRLTA